MRGWAQQVFSARLQGEDSTLERLLDEYCSRAPRRFASVVLGFIATVVTVDDRASAEVRHCVVQGLLDDIVKAVAAVSGQGEASVAMTVAGFECAPAVPPAARVMVRAAQTVWVSHWLSRGRRREFLPERDLEPQQLSDLVPGVLLLVDALCRTAEKRVSMQALVTEMLPTVVALIERGARVRRMSTEEFARDLWLRQSRRDCADC